MSQEILEYKVASRCVYDHVPIKIIIIKNKKKHQPTVLSPPVLHLKLYRCSGQIAVISRKPWRSWSTSSQRTQTEVQVQRNKCSLTFLSTAAQDVAVHAGAHTQTHERLVCPLCRLSKHRLRRKDRANYSLLFLEHTSLRRARTNTLTLRHLNVPLLLHTLKRFY